MVELIIFFMLFGLWVDLAFIYGGGKVIFLSTLFFLLTGDRLLISSFVNTLN